MEPLAATFHTKYIYPITSAERASPRSNHACWLLQRKLIEPTLKLITSGYWANTWADHICWLSQHWSWSHLLTEQTLELITSADWANTGADHICWLSQHWSWSHLLTEPTLELITSADWANTWANNICWLSQYFGQSHWASSWADHICSEPISDDDWSSTNQLQYTSCLRQEMTERLSQYMRHIFQLSQKSQSLLLIELQTLSDYGRITRVI
jgi:hypothetical protein